MTLPKTWRWLALILLIPAAFVLFSEVSTASPDRSVSMQICPECDRFLLNLPLVTKHYATAHDDVIFDAYVDHTPGFRYSSDNRNLVIYSGESAIVPGSSYIPPGSGYTRYNRHIWYNGHSGTDMSVASGKDVYAMHSALVVDAHLQSEYYSDFGNYVLLRDLRFPSYYTVYAHLQSLSVGDLQTVRRGQIIGKTGNTGNVTAEHLHFGVYFNSFNDAPGYVLDPMGWMSQYTNPIRGSNTTAPTHYLFAAGYKANSSPNSEVADWNEGTMIANAPVKLDKTKRTSYSIGYTPDDTIDRWWTDNFGSAGVAYNAATSTCQQFEGGTYCTNTFPNYSPLFRDVPITHWAHRILVGQSGRV